MKKTTFIAILFAVVVLVTTIGYFMGIFDKSPSSVSVKTNIQIIQDIPASTPRAKITANYLTLTETQKHSTKEDCWVILNENIYDLSSYILQHPGGQGPILRTCGGDGSSAFNKVDQHLLPFVQKKMREYLLGAVVK